MDTREENAQPTQVVAPIVPSLLDALRADPSQNHAAFVTYDPFTPTPSSPLYPWLR